MIQVDPYLVLGLDRTATSDDVRTAFRDLARKTHPDHGGDSEEFYLVKTAYDLLIDPRDREYYDRHGASRKDFNPKNEAAAVITAWFMEVVTSCPDLRHSDIIADIRSAIVRQRRKYRDDRNGLCKELRRMATIRVRLSKRESELPAILLNALDQKRFQVVQSIRDLVDANLVLDAAGEILDDYTYQTDPQTNSQVGFSMGRPIIRYWDS